jgi:hypothetical protein
MYVRVPTFDIGPDRIEDAIRHFQDVSLPQLEEFEGFHSAAMLVDRKKGIVQIIAYYDTEEAITSTADGAKRLRDEFLKGVPGGKLVALDIYEVAVEVGERELVGVRRSGACGSGGC